MQRPSSAFILMRHNSTVLQSNSVFSAAISSSSFSLSLVCFFSKFASFNLIRACSKRLTEVLLVELDL